jgi:hypothetical protein
MSNKKDKPDANTSDDTSAFSTMMGETAPIKQRARHQHRDFTPNREKAWAWSPR